MSHARFEVYPERFRVTSVSPPAAVTVSSDAPDSWRWRLRGANGEIVASGESYTSRCDAMRACRRVAQLADEADVATVEA